MNLPPGVGALYRSVQQFREQRQRQGNLENKFTLTDQIDQALTNTSTANYSNLSSQQKFLSLLLHHLKYPDLQICVGTISN